MNGKDIAIETHNLTKIFTRGNGIFEKLRKKEIYKTIAVKNVNLEIKEQELFGLLGPNGAGKTSLIKILSTLLLPDEGSATVNGWDIQKNSFEVRMSIGLTLSSERQLYWKLTSKENLEYFGSLYLLKHSELKDRVSDILELMGLSDQKDNLVENFSSGNRQKIALARAMLNDPPILFLDEPTIGLDPSFSQHFRRIIKKKINKKEKKTILLTTHYMEEADQLCDRIAFIDKGKIIALDTPKNLKKSIDEKEIITFVLSRITQPMLSEIGKLEAVSSEKHYEKDGRCILKIYTESAGACMQEIIGIITAARSQVLSFNTSKPTLEDVFIKLTGSGLHE
ncbi:MAG: ATP-binding cassette domain-containing protein [Candidatus Methanofastidiosia archaeon]